MASSIATRFIGRIVSVTEDGILLDPNYLGSDVEAFSGDIDTLTDKLTYIVRTGATHLPSGVSEGVLLTTREGATVVQVLFNGGIAYTRTQTNQVWGEWDSVTQASDLFDEANIKTNYTSTFNRVNGVLTSILYTRSGESYLKLFVREESVLTAIKWYSGSVEDADNLLLTKTLVRTDGTLTGITVS